MFLTSASPCYIQYSSYSPLISKKSLIALSKQRIIQRNLVHFQGFPDCINNKEILLSKEYFGQYGNILKIVLVSKEDKIQNRKINSAYLTFENEEQAAYCILSVDSIKINNQLVRAFLVLLNIALIFLIILSVLMKKNACSFIMLLIPMILLMKARNLIIMIILNLLKKLSIMEAKKIN